MDKKTLQNIQTEIDASFLYGYLANRESDPNLISIFNQMSEIELSHAHQFMHAHQIPLERLPKPSWRAKLLTRIGGLLGEDYVLGVLLDTEKSIASAVNAARHQMSIPKSISDTAHVTILKNIIQLNPNLSGQSLARFESRHRSVGGNALRAAVLGGNDGLVSNFSLVMGIAGVSGGQKEIILTGIAGMLAGALSMALGEWISVKSSQELYENQMQLELEELETNPEGERKELILIYRSKGIPEKQAVEMVDELMQDKSKAHDVLIREELGINSEDLKGSAMEAAVASFFLFVLGAVIPVIPFLLFKGITGIIMCALFSALGLFIIGAAITLFTNKNVWYSGLRQVVFGICAAAISFGVGRLIGVSIA